MNLHYCRFKSKEYFSSWRHKWSLNATFFFVIFLYFTNFVKGIIDIFQEWIFFINLWEYFFNIVRNFCNVKIGPCEIPKCKRLVFNKIVHSFKININSGLEFCFFLLNLFSHKAKNSNLLENFWQYFNDVLNESLIKQVYS